MKQTKKRPPRPTGISPPKPLCLSGSATVEVQCRGHVTSPQLEQLYAIFGLGAVRVIPEWADQQPEKGAARK